jgi:quercetin dioxygenase-like cupin family protein
MTFIDFKKKNKIQIWEGIQGAFFHSDQITFGHVTLEKGINLPEHHQIHEQWTHVIEGEMEFTVNGETKILTPVWQH